MPSTFYVSSAIGAAKMLAGGSSWRISSASRIGDVGAAPAMFAEKRLLIPLT